MFISQTMMSTNCICI